MSAQRLTGNSSILIATSLNSLPSIMTVRSSSPRDWNAFFFDPKKNWPARLQALAVKRFGQSPDAQAAENYALDAVSANDWQRLREGYKGRGSPDAFLAITLKHLLEDYAVRKYGRKRPPTWIVRLGTVWKRIHQMLCLQRQPEEKIVDHFCADDEHDERDIRSAILQIKGRVPDCGQYLGEYLDDEGLVAANTADEAHAPPERLVDVEWQILVDAVREALGVGKPENQVGRPNLALSDDERLLLRLVYHEGLSLPKAAKALKLHEQKARRMHRAVIERLHEELVKNGF
jgi:DNA-directed RNA polymerase specialized sigma24 family protein